MGIIYSDQAEVHEYGQGVWVKKLAVPETGTQSISVGVATFDPGAALPCHTHGCEESITIIEGEAFVEFGGKRIRLKPYDTSHMLAGVPHRFINASATEKMSILWVYASTDMSRTIVAPEECSGRSSLLGSLDQNPFKAAL
jgi:quercetin dioxygenase-like cupin family protein